MDRDKVSKIKDVDKLIELLTHDDWNVSDEAVYQLGFLGDKKAINPLLNQLKLNWEKYGESGSGMRSEIRNSLEKLGYIFKDSTDKFGPW